MLRFTAFALLLVVCATTALAQNPLDVLRTDAEKRAWIAARLNAEVIDPLRRQQMLGELGGMSPDQVDQVVNNYVRQTQINQQRIIAAQNQYYGGGGVIGYQPVITTLPTGTSLNAGGVIGPDGRYVRVNAQPFFSNVGPVQTFNYGTGQTGVYQPQTFQPQTFQPQAGQRPVTGSPYVDRYIQQRQPPAQPKTYHDGLRTRTR